MVKKRNKPSHIKLTISRIQRIVDDCKFRYLSEIDPGKVIDCLAELRDSDGISNQTSSYYLVAIQAFCRWAVKNSRLNQSPIAHIEKLETRTDRRHDRQSLSPDQLIGILAAAMASEKTFRGLTGKDRHFLYLAAMTTGFRVGELASLHPEDFDLECSPPTATVSASCTKNKQTAVQPIAPDVANEPECLRRKAT